MTCLGFGQPWAFAGRACYSSPGLDAVSDTTEVGGSRHRNGMCYVIFTNNARSNRLLPRTSYSQHLPAQKEEG